MTAKLKLETLRPNLEVHTFSPSNREATAQNSVSSRLASFLQQISDQPWLPSETLSQWNKISKNKNNWIPRFPCAWISYWKENRTVSSNSRHWWVEREKTHVHFMFVGLLSWKGVKKEFSPSVSSSVISGTVVWGRSLTLMCRLKLWGQQKKSPIPTFILFYCGLEWQLSLLHT